MSMANNRFYVCSLCHMHFVADESFDSRRVRHDEWHMEARKQGRNTTQGTPIYVESVTFPKDLLENLLDRVTELEERIDYITNGPEDYDDRYDQIGCGGSEPGCGNSCFCDTPEVVYPYEDWEEESN